MSIDPRGYKTFIQQEAKSFLEPEQLRLNTLVKNIQWSSNGVEVILNDGSSISADYAICTFSVGVLQNDDVKFTPSLPGKPMAQSSASWLSLSWNCAAFKTEAIASMAMATYTKIFLQFPEKFWFDTQFALYADPERGRYPVWQSLDVEGFMPGSGIIFVTVT
ncbi:hypothetical protein C0991_007884, partial [Blastosporella zonata]